MSEWIYGRNAVHECLRADRRSFHKLLIAEDLKPAPILEKIRSQAQQKKLPIERVKRSSLSRFGSGHQGLALSVSDYPYSDISQILSLPTQRSETPFILLLDTLQDPQNLGSLLRTAELAGIHGVIIPPRRAAAVTPAVVNSSSGGSEHLHIAQSNLAQAIDILKKEEIWVIGLDGGPSSQPIDNAQLSGPLALVVGSEGQGMRRLIRESCDLLVKLPMRGQLDSLNAAVAGSIVLYMALQSRS